MIIFIILRSKYKGMLEGKLLLAWVIVRICNAEWFCRWGGSWAVLCLKNIFLKQQHTLWFLTSIVFEPQISMYIHKYSDLAIWNEIITIMALNNMMCNEKEKKTTVESRWIKNFLQLREIYVVCTGLEEMTWKFHCLFWCV